MTETVPGYDIEYIHLYINIYVNINNLKTLCRKITLYKSLHDLITKMTSESKICMSKIKNAKVNIYCMLFRRISSIISFQYYDHVDIMGYGVTNISNFSASKTYMPLKC